MMHSMTAFARQHHHAQGAQFCWELRSVNHRYLEISVSLPDDLRGLELAVRAQASAVLKRGKVDCRLRMSTGTSAAPAESTTEPTGKGLRINQPLLAQLLETARQTQGLLANPAPFSALDVLRWPGIIQLPEPDTEQLGGAALALLHAALGELVAARAREGSQIMAMIEQRCQAMDAIIAQVRQQLPDVLAQARARLMQRCADMKIELDPARLELEMLMLIQKLDLDEELERLEIHVKEVRRGLHVQEPTGRRLDFLMQELTREANTLGAKSADADTTRGAIDLKVLIEQMREQIQNIE